MITAVTTCMGRLDHLEITLPLMLEEFERVIVVDWSCPQHSGEWAAKQGAEVVYQTNQKYFSISKARNVGARCVQSRSVCFIDADTVVMAGLKAEIESQLDISSFVIAARRSDGYDISDLGGFLAVDIGRFWGVKGYNESLQGYSLEDSFLRAQLHFELGLKPKRVSRVSAIRHTHELRGRHFEEPIEVSSKRNYQILNTYVQKHGVSDWLTDPVTSEICHRTQ